MTLEDTNQEITQEEITQEEVTEEATQEETVQPQPTIDINFDEFGFDNTQPEPEPPNYDHVISEIVQKTLEAQKIKAQEDKSDDDADDMTYLSKKELAEYETKIEQKILNKIQEEQKAQKVVYESIQNSHIVKQTYANKVKESLLKNGIDLDQNPQLKSAADLLYNNLELSFAAQNQRLAKDPRTGQPIAVLTPQETQALIKQHWDIFSKTYLPGFRNIAPKPNTSPLGAGATSVPGDVPKQNDAFAQFMAKKSEGKETMQDALNLLLKTSTKK